MDDQTSWNDEDLLRALDRYEKYLSTLGLSPATVDSDLYYCGLFRRWRIGDYVPRGMPTPTGRPVPPGRRDLASLNHELEQYKAFLPNGLKPSAVPTYVGPPRRFLDRLGGMSATRRPRTIHHPSHKTPLRTAVALSPDGTGLADAFARIRGGHREAIVRTVAKAALPNSVSRVFATGTAAALVRMLPGLLLDELPSLSGQTHYREWFEAALGPVAATILGLNPPELRKGIHPGYKWGHGTKVLSLFVRDLVLFSRYFTEEEAGRIERWLYCPIDSVVMDGLRQAGLDPGVTLIREIDQAEFWRIQDALSVAAEEVGVPRVWFDDVWSETRG